MPTSTSLVLVRASVGPPYGRRVALGALVTVALNWKRWARWRKIGAEGEGTAA